MCECTEPGFCEFHKIFKNKALFEHCKRGEVVTLDGRAIEPPSFLKKVVNYTKATGSYLLNGMQDVNTSIYNSRTTICRECVFFNEETVSCDKCGCPIMDKCKRADQSCPDNPPKWLAIISNSGGCGSCDKKGNNDIIG